MGEQLRMTVGGWTHLKSQPVIDRWSSDRPDIVSVSDVDVIHGRPGGELRALKAGRARILGMDGKRVYVCVDVIVELEQTGLALTTGQQGLLPLPPGDWTLATRQKHVVEVAKDGNVRALSPGIAVINAKGTGGSCVQLEVRVTGTLEMQAGQSVSLSDRVGVPVAGWRTGSSTVATIDANGKENTVRMAGWWDLNHNIWREDKGFVGTYTGNLAWVVIALLSCYEKVNESTYLEAARVLGEWIVANVRDPNGSGGYTGGYEGWEATNNNPHGQTKLTWKSTEHNIDAYVAFTRLYELTEDPNWLDRAHHAQMFIEAMWDASEGHFWTGTLDDGITLNKGTIPLDIQAWAVIAMHDYHPALEWAESNCCVETDGFKGFDFNNDKDGIWFEGTAQMAVAYQVAGQSDKSDFCLSELRRGQELATNANGKGIVAASHDGVTTGFDWEYLSRLHIGATAWYMLAEMKCNPYWGDRGPLLGPSVSMLKAGRN